MFKRIISLFTALAFTMTQSGFAAMITADGKTDTTVTQTGSVYDVRTTTVSGKTGFNSFSNFDVYSGTTANLYLPDNTANLVNLVNGKKSQIDGILNAYKNGVIGGNVFFLNPNGIVIGAGGSVNVGALTLVTPTKAFMDSVIAQDRSISSALTQSILAGDIPLNTTGLVSIKGTVNAAAGTGLYGHEVRNEGQINTDYNASSLVNLNEVNDSTVVIKNGKVSVVSASDFTNSGAINAKSAEVNIAADNDIYMQSGSSVSAAAGNDYADAGSITLNAKNNVYLNPSSSLDTSADNGAGGDIGITAAKTLYQGGTFNAASQSKSNGTITSNAANTILESKIYTNGSDYTANADDITISDDSLIDTSSSSKNAGNITLSGKTITVGDNAALKAKGASGYSSGDITLTASDTSDGYIIKNNNSYINIGKNAVLIGKSITLSSEANNKLLFDDADKLADTVGNITLGSIADMGLFGSYVSSTVNSSVNIGSGAKISAEGALEVSSKAVSDASLTVPGLGVSVAVGNADVNSSVTIGSNATLSSGGDMAITSSSDTKMSVGAMALSSAATTYVPGDGAVAVGIMNSDNNLTVSQDASLISGGKTDLQAKTSKDMKVTSSASAFDDGTFGFAVTYSKSNVTNKLNMDGNITSAGDTALTSEINSAQNRSTASAGAGDSTVTFYIAKLMNASIDGIKNKLNFSSINTATNSNSTIGLGAAVSYSNQTNTSEAKIGSDADVRVNGDLTLSSKVTDAVIRQSANASVDSKSTGKQSFTKENGGAAAVAVAEYNDNSSAFIDDNALVDLSGDLSVLSTYSLPYDITWYKINGLSDITDKLNGNLGLQNGFINSWADATVSTEDGSGNTGNIAFAGSANVTNYNSSNKAYIGKNAKINQRGLYTSSGAVDLEAVSDVSTINVAGNIGITFFGDKGGKGIGASYVQIGYNNDDEAYIDDGAQVNANSLTLNSSLTKRDITIAVSGGKSESFGFNGTFNWIKSENDTLAHVSDSALINSAGKADITATDDTTVFNIAGSVIKGQNTGIGASVAISDITRNTEAYLGALQGAAYTAGTVADGTHLFNSGALNISANQTGDIYAYSLAGSIESGANTQASQDSEGDGGKYGIGVSGDVSYNTIGGSMLAYINGGYISASDISLDAEDKTNINTASGSVSIVSNNATSFGFAGSASANYITNTISSFIDNSVIVAQSLDSLAKTVGKIISVAASGTGAATGNTGIAVAGSVTINQIGNTISATAKDSKITASSGAASLEAKDTSTVISVAGGVSVAKTIGVGSSVGVNRIHNTVESGFDGSTVSAKNISASSSNDSSLTAVSGTVGAATKGGAAAASITVNTINNTTDVYAQNKASLTSTQSDVALSAKDDSYISATAGALGLGDKAGVGISTAVSTINNSVSALEDHATISAKTNSALTALAASTVETSSAAGGAAETAGVSGSVAVNDITVSSDASAKSSTISADGSVQVSAKTDNTINFYGGMLAIGGKAGLGGTVAVNNIKDSSSSLIHTSEVTAKGLYALQNYNGDDIYGLIAQAVTDDDINVWTFNGAGGGNAAVAASVSVTKTNNSANSLIIYSDINKNLDASAWGVNQQVYVTASNNADIDTNGGALSIAGNAGVGAVSDTVVIHNDTSAEIMGSDLKATGAISVLTDTLERYNAILISGGFSGDAGVAGNVAVANLQNTNNALIEASSISAGDVTSSAYDNVDLGDSGQLAVGAAAGALYAGMSGAVLVTDTANKTSAIIDDTPITASGKVEVKAKTKQRVNGYVPTLGAGIGGIAASVSVNTFNSDTEAYISGDSSDITSTKTDTAANPVISVDAENDTKIQNILASAGAGGVGVGAAVSVSKINGKTAAGIKANSKVKANNGTLSVTASNTRTINDVTVAAAAGAAALSGSVSVGSIGGNLDSDSISSTQSTQGIVDTELSRNGMITKDNFGRGGLVDPAANRLSGFTSDVEDAFSTAAAADQSAASYIGPDTVVSAKDINIKTQETDSLQLKAGGGAAGISSAAVGAAVAIGNLDSSAKAYISGNADVTAQNSLNIEADNNLDDTDVVAYFGTTSPYSAALGAAVAILNASNNTQSFIDSYAHISGGADISLLAFTTSDLHTQTVNVSAGLAAAGASVSHINKDGDTLAYLGDTVTIGKDDAKAGSLSVTASTDHSLYAESEAGSGGILSGTGTEAKAILGGKVSAYTGKDDYIYLTKNLNILTEASAAVSTTTYGTNVGALAVGVSISDAEITLDNSVVLADGNIIKAKDVTLSAGQTKASTDVKSTAAAGSLIGGTGANSTSSVTGSVSTKVGNDITIDATNITVSADSITKQKLDSELYNFGAIASVGANLANATSTVTAQTSLGHGLNFDADKIEFSSDGRDTLLAQAFSGSGAVLDGSGAKVTTTNKSNSLVNIGDGSTTEANNINANTFKAEANNITTQDGKVSAVSGSIVGAVVLQNQNNSTMKVNIDLYGQNNITAHNMTFEAYNNYDKSNYDYNLDASAYGVIGVPSSFSKTDINDYTNIIFGDNANIKTTEDSDGNSIFTANAYNNIKANDKIRLISGALVSIPTLEDAITNKNNYARISVEDAKIKTAQDLNFNVKSDLNLNSDTGLSVYGGSAVAKGTSKAESIIDNQIFLDSGSDVFALGDVNFGLTQPNEGDRAKMYTNATTDVWNKTGLPIDSGSEAQGSLLLNNVIDMQPTAKLRSAKDINMTGSKGIVGASGMLSTYTADNDIQLATKDNASYAKINQNSVFNLNGQVLAGVNNLQHITIDANGNVVVGNQDADISYTKTKESLSNNILQEIEYYKKLKQAYSGSDAISGAYAAEISRLEQELADLGLTDTSNGTNLYSVVDDVDFITFGNISSNRGDINLLADTVTGSGKLSAPGYAEVTINNDSPYFLRLNDVLISDTSHGDINYNGVKVASNADINAVNASGTATFSSVESSNTTASPVITINNNYTQNGKASNLELVGNIENKEGAVNITSAGNIYSKGHIRGTTINMTTSGDVVQSYTDGFTHVGGEPSESWSSVATDSETDKTDRDVDTTAKSGVSSIIGNNVFISGRYLNINGLVQSGVADWTLSIPSGTLTLTNSLTPQTALADYNTRVANHEADVSELYKLSSSYGNIPAYYNVLTGQIVIKDFAVEGGRMELYGHILNTGDSAGQLRVLDGYGRVNITNDSGKDIVLGSVDNSTKISGVIKITDLAKKTSSGQYLTTTYTYNNGAVTAVTNDGGSSTTSGRSSSYNPVTGERYVWTTGQESIVEETYTKSKNSFWGMDFLVPDENDYDKTSRNLSSSPLMEGEYVDLGNTSDTHTYSYDYTGPVEISKIKTYDQRWTEHHGWWIFSTTEYHHKLIYETGYKDFHTHSIKADYPIAINFIGYDSPTTSISSSSGNLLLSSGVNAGTGNVALSASNGSITSTGDGSVTGGNISLNASSGIGSSGQSIELNLKGGTLNASTTAGDINLSAEAVKDAAGNTLAVNVGTLSTGSGSVTLNADGSVLNASSSSLIKGDTVNINSSVGTIGTLSNAVNIDADVVSASAKGDINLKQTSGDLGVNSITSATGDVNLEVSGNLYDANENETADTRTQEELLNTWNDMDLFGAAGWNLDQLKYAVNASSLKNTVDTQYMSEAPNITAKNVTVKAGGSIGLNTGSEVIDLSNYSALSDAQKLLIASAESDNLYFTYDAAGKPSSVTVYKTEDFDIHSSSVNLNANKYIYLGAEKDINVDALKAGTGENITIRGAGGVYNVSTSSTPNITGNDLVIEAAGGSIGSASNPLTLDLTGKIIARAQNNVYLASAGNIKIDSILSQGETHLTSDADILNASGNADATNIKSAGIWLNAVNIGSDALALGVNLDQTSAAEGTHNAFNANASGDLNVNGTNALYTQDVQAGDKATLSSDDGLFNASSAAKVKADKVMLGQTAKDIGSASDRYNVEADTISASSDGNIYLYAKANEFKDFTVLGAADIYSASANSVLFDNISGKRGVKIETTGNGTVLNEIYSQNGNIDATADIADIMLAGAATAYDGKLNLTAADSIYNAAGTQGIFGTEINLVAQSGGIGTKATPLKIDGNTSLGVLNASAVKDIYISGLTPNVKLGSLGTQSDISLEAESSIEAVKLADDKPNVKAANITITAENGYIGTADTPVVAEVNENGGKINLLAADGIYLKDLLYTFYADYVKDTRSGDIVLDVPTNDVRITELQKQNGFEVLLRDKKSSSGITISDQDIKKLLVDPLPVRPVQQDIPLLKLDIFRNVVPVYAPVEFAWNK